MSLLNDVLADLQDRYDAGEDDMLPDLEPTPVPRPRRAWPIVAVAGIVVAALACGGVLLSQRWPSLAGDPPSVSARPPDARVPRETVASPSGVQLEDVRIERGDGHSRLHLTLDDEAEYWIDGDPELGQIELVLSDTRISAPLPALRTGGTPIRGIEARESDLGLHVFLDLEPGVRVQTQVVGGRGGRELILDLVPGDPGARGRMAPASPENSTRRRSEPDPDDSFIEITPARDRSRRVEQREDAEARHARRRGASLLERRKFSSAAHVLENALALQPDHRGARRDHAFALIALGQLAAARGSLAIGLSLAPEHRTFVLLQSRVLMALDAHTEAVALLETAVAREPDDEAYLDLLAAAQNEVDPARAASVYRLILKNSPVKATAWMGLGIALDGDGRSEEALAAFRMATSLDGLEPDARSWTEKRISALSRPR